MCHAAGQSQFAPRPAEFQTNADSASARRVITRICLRREFARGRNAMQMKGGLFRVRVRIYFRGNMNGVNTP